MSALAKASIAFVVSSFLLKGINFITTPIFTRLMSTGEYGVLSTYNSWISIVDVFACLGLTSAGIINVGLNEYKASGERKEYLSSMTGLCNFSTIIVFIAIVIIQKNFRYPIGVSNTLLLVMFIHLFFNPAQVFWITAERFEYRYKAAVGVTVLSTLTGTIISLVAVIFFKKNLGAVKIIFQELGNALFYVPIYIYILSSGKRYINLNLWKTNLLFALPLIPHYLSQHIMTSADRIMLANMISSSAAGIYSVVATINSVALLFWNAINSSLMPFTFEKINNKDTNELVKVINILMVGYAGICVAVTLIAPELLSLLGPGDYQKGKYAVPPIVAVAYLTAVYNLFSNVEFYYKKSGHIASATVAAAITNLGLNFMLIPKLGLVAAAYTTLISNIILVLMHYFGYKKVSQLIIYNDKVLFILTLVCVCACILSSLLYMNRCIRYSIIFVFFVVGLLMRRHIIDLIACIKRR